MHVAVRICSVIKSLFKTAVNAVNGNLKKIDNAIQLNNAIEIFERKHSNMKDKYFDLLTRIKEIEGNVSNLEKCKSNLKAKGSKTSAINSQKLEIYDASIAKLNAGKEKLESVRKTMKDNILQHHDQIELLKTKVVYLNSLKTVNSYLSDLNENIASDDGISSIVDKAIFAEEAISEAWQDIQDIA